MLVDREAAETLAVDPRFAAAAGGGAELPPPAPVGAGAAELHPEAEGSQLLATVLGDLVGA
ncbi:MAG TPA: hypothetical protein VHS35_20630, partial [Pseudonocardia sp.]|nr:hypothetical protein [Pseudonocardia sp.]